MSQTSTLGCGGAPEALIVFLVFKWRHGFTRLFVLLLVSHACAEAYCIARIEIIS